MPRRLPPGEPENGKAGALVRADSATLPEKSVGKSAPGVPFAEGTDPRRGRGPLPGAPNAGRPPSAVQVIAREGWVDRVPKLFAMIDDPDQDPRVVIAAMAELRNGSGLNRVEVTGADGAPVAPQTWCIGDREITF